MSQMNFEDFKANARAQGFDEVLVRDWEPDQIVAEHSHPFTAQALMVMGEMWLTVGDQTQHLLSGDTFELAPGTKHSERYGSQGATYWVARRNAATATVAKR